MFTREETTEMTINDHGNLALNRSENHGTGWLSQHTGPFQRKPQHFQGPEKRKAGPSPSPESCTELGMQISHDSSCQQLLGGTLLFQSQHSALGAFPRLKKGHVTTALVALHSRMNSSSEGRSWVPPCTAGRLDS